MKVELHDICKLSKRANCRCNIGLLGRLNRQIIGSGIELHADSYKLKEINAVKGKHTKAIDQSCAISAGLDLVSDNNFF